MYDDVMEKLKSVDFNPEYYAQTLSALTERRKLESVQDAGSALLLGRALLFMGRYKAALNVLYKALRYFESSSLAEPLFHCFTNLTIILREMGQLDQALHFAEKARGLCSEAGMADLTPKALLNLSSVYGELGECIKSLELLEQTREILEQQAQQDVQVDLYINYAHGLIRQDKLKEAMTFLSKAAELHTDFYGDQHTLTHSIIHFNIGDVYFLMEMLNKSELNLKNALAMAEELKAIAVQRECHKRLVNVYERKGDYRKAFIHYKAYDGIEHLISTESEQEAYEKIKTEYEAEIRSNEEKIHMLRNVELKSKTTDLERTLKNVSMIAQVGQQLTSTMDMEQIFSILSASIGKLMPVNVFGLALYSQKTQCISYKYFEENKVKMPLVEIGVADTKSLAAYCIRNNEDILIRDFEHEAYKYLGDETFVKIGDVEDETTHCIIYCRLITEAGCIGLITFQSYFSYEYDNKDFEIVKTLAGYVAIAISNAQKKNILLEKTKELEFLSYNDSLTELYNRRFFHVVVDEWIRHKKIPIGLLIADMNHLKKINDQYGHAVGDMYLIEVARILKQCAKTENVFRLGGDEFAILVSHATEKSMEKLVESILMECDRFTFEYVPLSIAMGFKLFDHESVDFTKTFAQAESNMYLEKNRYHFKR